MDWEHRGLAGLYLDGYTLADKSDNDYDKKVGNLKRIHDALVADPDHNPLIDDIMKKAELNITGEDIWSDYIEGV